MAKKVERNGVGHLFQVRQGVVAVVGRMRMMGMRVGGDIEHQRVCVGFEGNMEVVED